MIEEMQPAHRVRPVPPDQISPKSVILKVIQAKNTLLRNWKLVLILMLVGGAIGFAVDQFNTKKPTFTATITFNLGGGSSGSPFGGLGDLAGAFGLSGSAPDANIFTGDNFLYYAKSRPIFEKALMKEVTINGKKVLLVNHYIEKSGIRDEDWEDNDTLRAFRFPKKEVKNFNKLENEAMGLIFSRLTGETTVFQPDRKSSFMSLKTGTQSELLSKVWAETLLETIEEDYKAKQTKKTRDMYNLLVARADSLSGLLNSTENRLARYIDQNQQMVVASGQVQQTRLTRNSTFLQSQYLAALQSADNLRLALIKEAPLFTIIEPVALPLFRENHESHAMEAGLILGLLIAIIVVFVRETYRSIMQDQ